MKTSKRLDQALQKLYTAFHNNTLNPECCKQCAVGNICDGTDSWKHLSNGHGTFQLSYVGRVHQSLGRRFNGYTPLELLNIEAEFLKGCGYTLPLHHKNAKPKNPTDKETLFGGLAAAIAYLCKLEGISNVIDPADLLRKAKAVNPQVEAEV
ncbi:MAG: Na(+)-translocating NADH-quinone reductase subunit F [Aequorivita sp.]|nr:Na(+)-translocating NADH-quinone reductase subunit F [Aequorivita sp.]MAO47755.1 Na(+)-translocating NADH-quinone reductase subunit F [Aequorivita sp.]MBF29892.1 Na(+)-translocating NADH-quinone reductase subunit F [Aequorivita sp.]|tara:strand:+ start:80234 stop:80689 length:456 start_codon:yes stop_codon:yes gene_type:complete